MWPAFISLTAVDALIGAELPPAGDGWSPIGAGITLGAINLIGIVLLSTPGALLLRRLRPDLPKIVAKDYVGTSAMVAITAALIGVGLANRAQVRLDQRSLNDAIVRAQAFIGDRAPARFTAELARVDVLTIQQDSIYRVCVPSRSAREYYCVVVRLRLPFADSVQFAGSEPNAELGQGTG
jgi:hypothetical protein